MSGIRMPQFSPKEILLRWLLVVGFCFLALFAVAQDDDNPPGPPIVVGYFPGWQLPKRFFVKNLLSNGAAKRRPRLAE